MPSGLRAGQFLCRHGLRRAGQKHGSIAMATQGVQHELLLSRRMARLGTETAFEVLSKAKALERKGRSIVHLEIGEPDFSTPPHIVEAAVDALRGGWTHYSPSAGLPELREAIASYVSRTRGVAVEPDEVVVVPGGKPIMFYVMLALVDEGDEVIYPNPGFPIYESMIRYAGGTPVPIPLREERDFAMDVDEMARLITPSTKLIILNSPQNPTGGVLARGDIERAAAAIGDRNILVLADEIYSRLQFEGKPFSIMSVPGMQERTILLDGFSKTYAMTGWRIGYGVMRADLAAQITRLMTNSNSCTASFTQRAALAALAATRAPWMRCAWSSSGAAGPLSQASTAFAALARACRRAHSMSSPTSRARDGRRSRWPMRCSKRPAWPRFPAPRLAPMARAICASVSPIPWRT